MSIVYAVAAGYDRDEGDLVPLNPQPSSVGVVPGRRLYNAAHGYYEDLHAIAFFWALLGSATAYRSVLTQLGLNAADAAAVTLRVRDDNFQAWVVNATVLRPEHGSEVSWSMPFPRRVTILARVEPVT